MTIKLSTPHTSTKRVLVVIVSLALLLGAAVGIAVNKINQPLYILVGLVGLLSFIAAIASVEFGLLFLVFITYTRFSDVIVHYHNAPSVAKSFIVLLIVAILFRWAIFNEKPDGWQLPLLLIGAYGLVGFASILYAQDPTRVVDTLSEFVKDAIIALVVVVLLKRGHTFRYVIWTLILVGIFLGSLSVYQYLTKTFTNEYGGFALAQVMQIVGATNDYRISGPIGDPNFFAQAMVVLVPIALERMLHEQRILFRILAGLSALVTILTIVFTFSRGGFLALVVTLVVLFLLYPPLSNRLPLFVLSVVVVMIMIPPSFYQRILSLGQVVGASNVGFRTEDLAIRGRASELLTGWEMIKDHPMFGVGLKNYSYLYASYSKDIGLAPSVSERSAHNLYLEVAAETGFVGLFIFFLILRAMWVSLKFARTKFLMAGLDNYSGMVTALAIGTLGYLVAAIFVHAAFPRYFYLLVGLSMAMRQVAQNTVRELGREDLEN